MDNTTTNVQGREIKFRAWNEYGMGQPFTLKEISEFLETRGTAQWPKDTIFLQFTGLRDKSGKEIYEGDLIAEIDKIEDLEKWGEPLAVEFGEFIDGPDTWGVNHCTTGFLLRYKDGSITGLHNKEGAYGFESKEIMVIGNIYEHPHLLKTEGIIIAEGLIDLEVV